MNNLIIKYKYMSGLLIDSTSRFTDDSLETISNNLLNEGYFKVNDYTFMTDYDSQEFNKVKIYLNV